MKEAAGKQVLNLEQASKQGLRKPRIPLFASLGMTFSGRQARLLSLRC